MKNTILLLLSLLGILLMNSCEKEVYDPNAVKDDYFIKNIPDGLDWSPLAAIQTEITPNDQYNGKYFYTIEVFDQNPLLFPQATLFAKGVCKQNQPFATKITLPEAKTAVFVRQTDPTGKKSIQIATPGNGKLVCSFLPSEPSVSSTQAKTDLTKTNNKIDWEIPDGVKEISGNGTFMLESKVPYLISGTYTGSITFPGEGRGILYITGTWNNTAANTSISQNSEIYVLNGGKVLSEEEWQITTNGVTIAIAEGGQWGEQEHDDIDIQFHNPSDLINYGSFYADDITTHTGNTNIFNDGQFHIDELVTNNPGRIENNRNFTAEELRLNHPELVNNEKATLSVEELSTENGTLLNKHRITAESIAFSRTKVTNECSIECEELDMTQGSYEQAGYTSLICDKMEADGVRISLNSFSLLVAREKIEFTSQLSKIEGCGKDFAVLRTAKIEWQQKGPHVKFSGNLEINCPEFEDNPPYNPYYTLSGSAYFAQDGSSVKIPASECTGEGNVPDEGTPENPEFPYPESMTQNHTWLIEDTYPGIGDYDMNDLVVGIDSVVRMMTEDYEAESMTLYIKVRAVGGTRHVGAALQLDGISPSAVKSVTYSSNLEFSENIFTTDQSGTESGQTYAVIPLFENAHKVLGLDNTTTIVNTISPGKPNASRKEPQNIKITIQFSTPIPGDILTMKKLNIFAVVASLTSNRDTEIHLPEFMHTDKSGLPQQVQQSTKGLMWGLLLPGQFRYAEERTEIRDAYPQFQDWVSSGKEKYKDWYEHPNEANIYRQ